MAEPATPPPWAPRRAWEGTIADGRFGAEGPAGVTIRGREALGIATLIATGKDETALAAALRDRFGLAPPQTPVALCNGAHSIVWNGPGQWLLIAERRAGFADDTLKELAQLAAVSDQSDSRAVLSLSGPSVRDALAKGCMVDLHPAAFPVGAVAVTSIAHMGVCLWRTADTGEGPAFAITVARSVAGSFWSWLSASVAEFGCVVARGDT